ncbi:hypothetical protein GSI_00665 [Ganoderma sinense ZZ0214-1]|uniref:Uncharacterized protein n=1 Tax=Ganoderma sinense ZZ0214-1 TaxID=1077348 RepID=A0A2G8STD8_9APHY|nr:hypothetical protein GSI_00665 [Ganoderma sinense ZZ0214-1]
MTRSRSSTVTPPGRSTRRFPSSCKPSTTVLSTPTPHGPPSRTMPNLPCRSLYTCSARVGLGFPDEFALGAATGASARAIRALATGWDGIRTATVGWFAVMIGGTMVGSLGKRRVRGPGQKCFMRTS